MRLEYPGVPRADQFARSTNFLFRIGVLIGSAGDSPPVALYSSSRYHEEGLWHAEF